MEPKRILIFNVNWLGDVLFSTAAIRNIRINFPHAYLACAIPARCYLVLKDNPHLDEIMIFDEKDRHKGVFAKLDFVRLLKSKQFDTVFLLHRSFTRALICRLAGIGQRIGYYTKKRSFLLTRAIKPPSPRSMHRIDYYLNILEKAGLRLEDRFTEFFVSDADVNFIVRFLKDRHLDGKGFLVALNPGANWAPKRWPAKHWALLADSLIDNLAAKVIIVGSSNDASIAREITASMHNKPVVACGLLNLKKLAALFKRVGLLVTADTGPLHIANAVGAAKIIALFGPTDPAITGPYPDKNVALLFKDVGCKVPCYKVNCKDNRCMKAISVQDVLEKIAKFKS